MFREWYYLIYTLFTYIVLNKFIWYILPIVHDRTFCIMNTRVSVQISVGHSLCSSASSVKLPLIVKFLDNKIWM